MYTLTAWDQPLLSKLPVPALPLPETSMKRSVAANQSYGLDNPAGVGREFSVSGSHGGASFIHRFEFLPLLILFIDVRCDQKTFAETYP